MPVKKKPWYKRWRVWLVVFVGMAIIGGTLPDGAEEAASKPSQKVEAEEKSETKPSPPKSPSPSKTAPSSEPTANTGPSAEAPKTKPAPSESPDNRVIQLRSLTEKYADEYDGSEIDKIVINENLGADDGSYIVLANMSFPRQNSANQSLKMIEMYSEDLAARLAKEADVSEVTVFWAVPRFVASGNAAKYNYLRKDAGMYLDNSFIAPELQ